MGDDDRVVLRSPWRAGVLNITPVAAVVIAVNAWGGAMTMASLGTVAVVFAVVTVFFHYLSRVVLTSHGLELRQLSSTVVPWSQVEAVFVEGSRFTEYRLKLLMPDVSARSLPAPRAVFGSGRRQVDEARDLVEQWWLRHGGRVVDATAPASVPSDDPGKPPPA
jgi:hypothetical protein